MRTVVRRRAIHHRLHAQGARDEVGHVRASLADRLDRRLRREDVVVDDVRAVRDLDEEVAAVVVEHVPRHPGALGLPVEPDPQRAVVDEVVSNLDVDRGVQLDAADLVAEELTLRSYAIDVVVMDPREDTPEVADDTVLAAVVDLVVADHVRADRLLAPAHVETSLPMEIAEHLASWMSLSSMIQPFDQLGPTRPGWSAVGGAHGVAACASSKPRTVM